MPSFLSLLLATLLALGHLAMALDVTQQSSSTTTGSSCLLNSVLGLALQLKDQSHQLGSLQAKVTALETQLSGNTVNTNACQRCNNSIAFSAKYEGGTYFSVGTGGTLKYPSIVTNLGGGYSTVTGHFTAPCTGTYAFYTSLRSSNDQLWILLGIFKGSTQLAEATGKGRDDKWDRGSIFVTAHMQKGEIAYVRHTAGGTHLEAGGFTTFSGFLVAGC